VVAVCGSVCSVRACVCVWQVCGVKARVCVRAQRSVRVCGVQVCGQWVVCVAVVQCPLLFTCVCVRVCVCAGPAEPV